MLYKFLRNALFTCSPFTFLKAANTAWAKAKPIFYILGARQAPVGRRLCWLPLNETLITEGSLLVLYWQGKLHPPYKKQEIPCFLIRIILVISVGVIKKPAGNTRSFRK